MNFGIIQVAGILDQAEAVMLQESGVDWLGFPLKLDKHEDDIDILHATKIVRSIRKPHESTLITYVETASGIADLSQTLGVNRVQLHGKFERQELARLRRLLPQLSVIKSLIVTGGNSQELLEIVRDTETYVDAYITDTFDPVTGASGATGQTHDWKVSEYLVKNSLKPIILAGGLTPINVASAILQVRPFGVDAHTGLEDSEGRKSPVKVRDFVKCARQAFAAIAATRSHL